MKATGIVRRIDDLGRVVIPKEIRRTMRIREGDPLEIFTERDGEVIFKKYSPIGELGEFAAGYAETLAKTSGLPVVITDKDSVIAVSGAPKKELVEKRISEDVEKMMEKKIVFAIDSRDGSGLPVVDGSEKYFAGVVAPIVSEGDIIGSVMMVSDKETMPVGEVEKKLCQSAAGFLGKHMED
ncbi:MAG: stage V sporulation protein T [Clostridia bacterium]|nr:stage V sporulation protein T [Clostridia bacterium]